MQYDWLKNYPKGVPTEIDPNEYESVKDIFLEACEKYKDRPAYSCMGAEITYGELNEKSLAFASFLQNEAKLKKGDRIALQMPNILQFPVCLFGAIRAGLVVVNTNPLYTKREMHHQFTDAGVKAIVIVENFASNLEEILDQTDIETVVTTELGDMLGFPKSLIVNKVVKHVKKMVPKFKLPKAYKLDKALELGAKKQFQDVHLNHEDLAFLQYTGGTTGVAKGAMLTHKNIVSNMLQVSAWIDPMLGDKGELVCTPLPLYHIFSLTVNCLSMTRIGAKNLLITNPRDIPTFIKTLQKNQVTVFTGLNTLFNALMNHDGFKEIDFSELKITVAGGMAMQTSVGKRWEELTGCRIAEGYGLTETSPVASVNRIDGTAVYGTIGIPIPSTDMKVIDENGEALPPGQAGELCIKGPQVMKGYWNRKEETDNAIDSEGWFKSGDVAMFTEDGYFKIVDRKKDMILVSGFNVYPNEVEDVVATLEGVVEVAAVGVDDEHSGEVVKVFVVRKDDSVTEEKIIEHCKQSLAGYKVPKHVEFKDELPKTNVGKILRRALRD